MQHLKPGDLVTVEQRGRFYVFLVLSRSAFFGSQWAFAFHRSHDSPPRTGEVGLKAAKGFVALIDFIEPRRSDALISLAKGLDHAPFMAFGLVKALIRPPGKEPLWYIYDRHSSAIIKTCNALTEDELDYPIWSGVHAFDATELIDMGWLPSHLLSPDEPGQYPIRSRRRL